LARLVFGGASRIRTGQIPAAKEPRMQLSDAFGFDESALLE
jgi:hypothetical protein